MQRAYYLQVRPTSDRHLHSRIKLRCAVRLLSSAPSPASPAHPSPNCAVLFKVVGRMSFSLGCVATCLYAAGCQVLSLDRTIGGRLFGAMLFLCCMLSAGILGGGIVSRPPKSSAHRNRPASDPLTFIPSPFPAHAELLSLGCPRQRPLPHVLPPCSRPEDP